MKPSERTVSSLLESLRNAEAEVEAPSHLEAELLAAWDAAHAPVAAGARGAASDLAPSPADTVAQSSVWTSTHVWQRAGAIAAAATLAFTLTLLGGKLRTGITPAPAATTMVLLGEPILEGESLRVVRMRVPNSTLAALGVRPVAGDLVDAVDVDVIVGEDGVARAIRVGM